MTLYTLNILDLLFTLYALSNGGVELNPLMQCVPFQIFYKVFVIGALCWWLNGQEKQLARVGLHLLTAAFAAVCGWHIYNIFGGFR